MSSLHNAAVSGDLARVRQCLNERVNVDERDDGGWTALMYAASCGKMHIVETLVEAGAEVNMRCEKPEVQKGETALHKAAKNGHKHIFNYLVDNGADRNARNWYGQTADFLLESSK